MTVDEVIVLIKQIVDRDIRNQGIALDDYRAVLLINRATIDVVGQILLNNNPEMLRYIQKLLIPNKALTVKVAQADRDIFKLPDDYFDISSSTCLVTNGKCADVPLTMFPVKDKNNSETLSNYNLRPDYTFRETPYVIADDGINVFKEGFVITQVNLSYYRYPKRVDKLDIDDDLGLGYGVADVGLEFDDKLCYEILNRAAAFHIETNKTK